MEQVNIPNIGKDYLNPGGYITLTTGILGDFSLEISQCGSGKRRYSQSHKSSCH